MFSALWQCFEYVLPNPYTHTYTTHTQLWSTSHRFMFYTKRKVFSFMQKSGHRVACRMNVTSLTRGKTSKLTTAVDLFVVRWQHHLCVLICDHLSHGLRQWHSISRGYHQILEYCEQFSWFLYSCSLFACELYWNVHLLERVFSPPC